MEDKALIILIKKEIKDSLSRNPSLNLKYEEIAQLFLDFMRLPINNSDSKIDGCSRVLNSITRILDENLEKKDRDNFLADLTKVEPFFRKILFYFKKDKLDLIELNKLGFPELIMDLELNPGKFRLDKVLSKDHTSSKLYTDHFIISYNTRVLEAHHLKGYSTKQTGEIIESSLMIYIYVCEKYKHTITEAIKAYSDVKLPEFSDYCDTIISDFRDRVGRIIHLQSKENITLSSTYVAEAIIKPDEDREIPVREGTIDELRKTKISENRMILWGEAGMGKTTTLEFLAYKDALEYKLDREKKLPVFIPLGFLTDVNISLKQYIFNKIGVATNIGEAMLDKGKLNLFLDGINEIPSDEKNQLRSLRQKEIDGLINGTPKSFIIISNRPGDVNIFGTSPIFIIQKMNDTQIEDFINKYTDNQTDLANLLKDKLNNDQRLKEIVKTPLMLSRLIEIIKSEGVIPENEGKIIDRFIKSLYKREKIEKKDANFNEDSIHRLLAYLACFCLETKGTNSGLNKNEVYIQFQKCTNDFGFKIDLSYVLEIVVQLNIIEIRENLYSFSHQSYLDYFYAEYERMILG